MENKKETQVKSEEEEFEYVLDVLRQQLLGASSHFYIYEQLWPTEKVVDVINRYKGFFQPTRDALLDCITIKVSDIVSNKADAPSFYRILKMVERDSRVAPDINVRKVKQRIKKHRTTLEAIKDYRNKHAAHRITTVRDVRKGKAYKILFLATKRLLKELVDIFNEISGSQSKSIWSFKYSEKSDVISLLDGLERLMNEDKNNLRN